MWLLPWDNKLPRGAWRDVCFILVFYQNKTVISLLIMVEVMNTRYCVHRLQFEHLPPIKYAWTWLFITFLSCGNQSFTIKLLANYFRLLHNNWRSLKIVHRRICIITGQNCYRQPLHCPRHRRLGKRAWMNVWTRAGEGLKRGCRKNRGQGFALSHRSLVLLCCLWISFITIHQPMFWYQAPIGVVW